MKSKDQLAKNYLVFNVFNSFGIIDFIWFGFVSFMFILDIHFSRKKLVLISLNAVIKIYSKIWELCMHPDYEHFLYSINFQKMQIPAINQYSSWK